MSIKKNKNQLIISILVGIAIFAVTYQFIIRQQEEIIALRKAKSVPVQSVDANTTKYVVTKIDIKKGDIIKESDIEIKDLGMKMNGIHTSIEDCVGKQVLKDIPVGRPVTVDSFAAQNTDTTQPKEGFRAVSGNFPSATSSLIKEGSYIDIYTSQDTVKAENVRILKILDTASKNGQTVVFEIKDEDVSMFIQGIQNDKIIPVFKSAADKGEYRFSYDPFKVSSFTMTDEEYSSLPPEAFSEENKEAFKNVSNVEKLKQKTAGGNTVEVIEGNTKKIMDFN